MACVIGAKVGKLGSSCGADVSILKSHMGQGNSCISLGASQTTAGAGPELLPPLLFNDGPNMSVASFGPPNPPVEHIPLSVAPKQSRQGGINGCLMNVCFLDSLDSE